MGSASSVRFHCFGKSSCAQPSAGMVSLKPIACSVLSLSRRRYRTPWKRQVSPRERLVHATQRGRIFGESLRYFSDIQRATWSSVLSRTVSPFSSCSVYSGASKEHHQSSCKDVHMTEGGGKPHVPTSTFHRGLPNGPLTNLGRSFIDAFAYHRSK